MFRQALPVLPKSISILRTLVKTLHPISEIADRVSQVNRGSVRLTHAAGRIGTAPDEQSNLPNRMVSAREATIAALDSPLDFPPLEAGIVPGDRVAIALDEDVPCAVEVIRGAILALQKAGVESSAISVVLASPTTNDLCTNTCVEEIADGVTFLVHNPDDNDNLCMVGLTKKRREKVVVNRVIFDADLVLPICCAHLHRRGAFEGLFPRFSDAEAIRRHRTPAKMESLGEQEQRARETSEAGWLIGVPMIVAVVPGKGEGVAHVVAGEPNAVAQRCEELARGEWLLESPQRVSLLIATVTGGPEAQTWMNIGRALATAEHLVQEGGAVAICSNLEESPGRSLDRLVGNPDLKSAERKISHEGETDSWPAWQLARALQRGPVYLLSRLDAETVEDLGLAPVENIDELVRLAERHESFAIVEDAQNAVVQLTGGVEDG